MSDRPIKLLIIDDDPIFRLGVCTALEDSDFADLQIIAQADTASIPELLAENFPDILILAIDINNLYLCQELLGIYPNLKIFLLTSELKSPQLILLKSYGVKGYVAKGTKIKELVDALRRVALGETYWQNQPVRYSNPIKLTWFSRQFKSGLAQITSSLEEVEQNLNNPKMPLIDYLFWQGRKRELLTAGWLVKQVFPLEAITLAESLSSDKQWELGRVISAQVAQVTSEELIPTKIFQNTLIKIQLGVNNLTGLPLEIDVLQQDKKQELLLIVLDKINKALDNLRHLQITAEDLEKIDDASGKDSILRTVLILQDIWQSSVIEFLSKYYLLQGKDRTDYNILNIVVDQSISVQKELLQKIPLVRDVFAYLLFEAPLIVDRVSYRSESPEALERAEFLLENLIINLANGVMLIVLNDLSLQEIIIKNFYNKDTMSSREIARFRNELAWRYWREKYWEEPKNIFEDRYSLLIFKENTIKKIYIDMPRKEELDELRSIAWLLTIVIEAQDAIAPRIRAVIDWLGRGLVYVLTEIIGRGIGLIGRGIIQGIGNSLQRYK